MFRGWKFFVDSKPWLGRENLYIGFLDDMDQRQSFVQPFTVVTYDSGQPIPDQPTIGGGPAMMGGGSMDVRNFLQAAMDAAWKLGLKPAGYEEASSELRATKYHLEDMRSLAEAYKGTTPIPRLTEKDV